MRFSETINLNLKDTNFKKIQQAMEAIGWTWGGGRAPTIIELIHSAENQLIRVAATEQCDYPSYFSTSGGFHAERNIYDGVMCLSLKFVIAGWDMDCDWFYGCAPVDSVPAGITGAPTVGEYIRMHRG